MPALIQQEALNSLEEANKNNMLFIGSGKNKGVVQHACPLAPEFSQQFGFHLVLFN